MKKHLINFPENNISIESFYDRLRPCYDSIMQFGDRVLVAQMNWNGMLEGAVYGFVEDPEEGWLPIECRLELLKISDETYTDAGHIRYNLADAVAALEAGTAVGFTYIVAEAECEDMADDEREAGMYECGGDHAAGWALIATREMSA